VSDCAEERSAGFAAHVKELINRPVRHRA